MVTGKQRAIPPDLWLDEDLIALPLPVKWTAIGLRMHADDEGRETTTDWMLRPSVWPGDPLSTDDLIEHLLVLDDVGYVGIYTANGRTYYQVRDWPSVSHPRRSKHPAPPPDLFRSAAGDPPEGRSAWGGEGEGGEWGEPGGDEGRPAGIPPSPFCRVHQPAGSGGVPCRHCGDARRAHDRFLEERRAGV